MFNWKDIAASVKEMMKESAAEKLKDEITSQVYLRLLAKGLKPEESIKDAKAAADYFIVNK